VKITFTKWTWRSLEIPDVLSECIRHYNLRHFYGWHHPTSLSFDNQVRSFSHPKSIIFTEKTQDHIMSWGNSCQYPSHRRGQLHRHYISVSEEAHLLQILQFARNNSIVVDPTFIFSKSFNFFLLQLEYLYHTRQLDYLLLFSYSCSPRLWYDSTRYAYSVNVINLFFGLKTSCVKHHHGSFHCDKIKTNNIR